VNPGFSAETDEREQATRGELRRRKLDRYAVEEPEAPGAVAAAATNARVVEGNLVLKQGEALAPSGFQPADPGTSPAEQLEHYERGLTQARIELEQATEQWVETAGQILKAIRESELFVERGYTSLDEYTKARWEFSASYANRLIRAVPVIQALHGVTHRELKERQLRPLIAVAEAYGADGVRKVWDTALQRGRTSGAGLEEAIRVLGMSNAETPAPVPAPRQVAPVAVVQRAWQQFGGSLRSAAEEDPDEVRRIVGELKELIEVVEKGLPQ
jgi:hypothetical protein